MTRGQYSLCGIIEKKNLLILIKIFILHCENDPNSEVVPQLYSTMVIYSIFTPCGDCPKWKKSNHFFFSNYTIWGEILGIHALSALPASLQWIALITRLCMNINNNTFRLNIVLVSCVRWIIYIELLARVPTAHAAVSKHRSTKKLS